MCGIAGLLGSDEAAIAARMATMLSHRGPDGSGFWSDDAGGESGAVIALGHARLAILDIAGSDQPIGSDHGCVLIQNGEIYGHQRIRRDEPGYRWRTAGDSESILAAHAAATEPPRSTPVRPQSRRNGSLRISDDWRSGGGAAARHVEWVRRLDGIWGFALWDARHRELILSRDPLGVKPLLRTVTADGTLLFASEAKAFRAHPGHSPRLDLDALMHRLAFEYPLDQTTLFDGVVQVAAGTIETWSLDAEGRAVLTGVARHSSDIVAPASSWNPEVDVERLLHSLRLDLADRLMSDVPIGIVLSGGLDSSLVAALAHDAAEIAGEPVPDCWTVTESEDNPDHLAAVEVASCLDLGHRQWTLESEAFYERLPDLAWHGEDLDVTVLFFQPLFEAMASEVTVGLCGQGADELHAGYPRYRDLKGHASTIRERLDACIEDASGMISDARAIGPGQPWSAPPPEPEVVLRDLPTALQFELDRGQLSNFQLRLVDRHSMAHGLEVRVPFLGSRHRALSHRLPLDQRLGTDTEKVALRRAAALTRLPNSIVDRPKLPAGTATSPRLLDEMLTELRPHAVEWAEEMGPLTGMLRDQPDLTIGLRLFQAMHLTVDGTGRRRGALLDLLEDVEPLEMSI